MTFEPNRDGEDPWDDVHRASADLKSKMQQLKTRYREERRKLETRSFAPTGGDDPTDGGRG